MATSRIEVSAKTTAAKAGMASAGMDRPAPRNRWSPAHWPIAAKLGAASLAALVAILTAVRLFAGTGEKTLRIPKAQLTVSAVEQGIFHDLIPLRARVEPRETVFIDAIDGGRIDRVLVEPGDRVQQGQPLIELSNTNLALSVIQQESQLNQAISQLQQNEIALEQNELANHRALAEIEYRLVKLERSAARREELVAGGATSREQRDEIADELAYYRRLHPIQAASSTRQSDSARPPPSRHPAPAPESAGQPRCRAGKTRGTDRSRAGRGGGHRDRPQGGRAQEPR